MPTITFTPEEEVAIRRILEQTVPYINQRFGEFASRLPRARFEELKTLAREAAEREIRARLAVGGLIDDFVRRYPGVRGYSDSDLPDAVTKLVDAISSRVTRPRSSMWFRARATSKSGGVLITWAVEAFAVVTGPAWQGRPRCARSSGRLPASLRATKRELLEVTPA